MPISNFRRAPLAVALLAAACAGDATAETMYGITGTVEGLTLVRFDSFSPAALTTIGPLTGLVAGDAIRAIDFRPDSDLLYAIGQNQGANTGRLYLVNLNTAVVTPIGAPFAFAAGSPRVSMDFNPVVDRIRLVSGTGISLRINPNSGAIAGTDTPLAYAAGDPNEGQSHSIADVAYSSNAPGTPTTTLYGIDYAHDRLVTIGGVNGVPSPNVGGMFTVGALGVVTSSATIGFDVSGVTGNAYASFNVEATPTVDRLSQINLATGAATLIGSFGTVRMLDISVQTSDVFANGFE